MNVHIQREIEKLKKKILLLFAIVEENFQLSVRSVVDKNSKFAEEVIREDAAVDQLEVDVEEECLKILALNQPVAIDLRFIIAVLKLNNDLERIGDLAVNIAQRAEALEKNNDLKLNIDFTLMAKKVHVMLKKSLNALVDMDENLAREVCELDNEVDDINRDFFRIITEEIHKNPQQADGLIKYLSVSRNLERIADHATNIAEDVIYMINGSIVGHKKIN